MTVLRPKFENCTNVNLKFYVTLITCTENSNQQEYEDDRDYCSHCKSKADESLAARRVAKVWLSCSRGEVIISPRN